MQDINKSHSILGVVSCSIGFFTFFVFLLASVFYYLQFQKITTSLSNEGLGISQMFALLILPIPIHILGLILGAFSLLFPNRKKLFPILGIVSNLIFAVISLISWLWLIIGGMGRA